MIYEKNQLREIRFPLGGIGTGSVCIAGNGRLCDFEIFNRPAKGSISAYSHFAVCAETRGCRYSKVLNGDYTESLMGQYEKKSFGGYGYGPSSGTMCGFPHFREVVFDGQFPIARLHFRDGDFPGEVTITAWSPLIPGDSESSSIPAAFFEISYENTTEDEVTLTGVLSLENPFEESENIAFDKGSVMLFRANVEDPDDLRYGDMTIAVDAEEVGAQEYWYRGGWVDGLSTYWNELTSGCFAKRHYDTPAKKDVGSVYGKISVAPHTAKTLRFVMTWSIPNRCNDWEPVKDEGGRDITWKNYYATRYPSSRDSARYAMTHFSSLYARTDRFRAAFFSQTLDASVIDAAASTLAVLKSPTVLRLEDGSFYGWEGVHEEAGSCEGTCQHVWNYAYALCFLFPELERSIRALELRYSLNPDGGMPFRLMLPLGHRKNTMRPCLDGQMGTIIKFYRDFKIAGDMSYLTEHWEELQRIMAFAWSEENPDRWDCDRDGVLEGRQHHTLDMELFGPHAWLEGFYLTALRAMAEMAHLLSDPMEDEYRLLFEKGYRFTRDELFNGRYFVQKLELTDRSVIDRYAGTDAYWNEEKNEIKYQIGEGCEIDQLCGQWHARLCGLGDVFDKTQARTALRSLYEYNYKPSVRDYVNPYRIFALNDEAATVICDYPEGAKKPAIPIPYCEESMNGFEYQLAGSLIGEGMIEEGLTLVRAVRARYNGENRNPYNEFECGSNYARSMASFALIPIFSGFYFDMPHDTVGFDPVLKGDFSSFWSLGCGYGMFLRVGDKVTISVIEGALPIAAVRLPFMETVTRVTVDGVCVPHSFENGTVAFEKTSIRTKIVIEKE